MEIGISTAFFRNRVKTHSVSVGPMRRGIYGKDFFQQGHGEYVKNGPSANELTGEELYLIDKAGFRYLELDPGIAIEEFRQGHLEKLAEDLEQRDIIVHSFHEFIYSKASLNSIEEADRKYVLDNDKKQIDRLQIFHPQVMVAHPGIPSEEPELAKRQKERCRASLDELAHYCSKKSITLAVENHTHPHFVEYLMELLAVFDPKDIGICLDTGHPHRIGEDVVEIVKVCKERLIALHCDDNHGKGSIDEHTVPYRGTINWGRVYGALEEIGYSGVFMYECSYQSDPERALAEIAESFPRMQREYKKIENGTFCNE